MVKGAHEVHEQRMAKDGLLKVQSLGRRHVRQPHGLPCEFTKHEGLGMVHT